MADWFENYEVDGFFDEVVEDDGSLRPHYAEVGRAMNSLAAEDVKTAESARNAAFRSQGITFTVYDDDDGAGVERTFPMDLMPRVIRRAAGCRFSACGDPGADAGWERHCCCTRSTSFAVGASPASAWASRPTTQRVPSGSTSARA